MPLIEIDDVGTMGIIRDQPPHMLPPEAWSDGGNVRIIDKSIGRTQGWAQVFGTLSAPATPVFATYISDGSGLFWLLANANGTLFVYDGSAWTAIGSFATAAAAKLLNGTILGGIPIWNNFTNVPKFWALPYSTATSFANLTNWPATLRTRVLRSFGPYGMALGIIDNSVAMPHQLRWSHPADPGAVPSTWDYTDTTKDAGRVEFPDIQSGIILDGLQLSGRFFVYKENAVWRMRLVGGRKIFDEDSFLDTIGLLATRCVALTSDGKAHIFCGQDDIWLHDGNNVTGVLDQRHKRSLFSRIDPTNFANSFMFTNATRNESWFCFPEAGQTNPTRALIINTKTLQITESDVSWVASAQGTVQTSDLSIWSTETRTWDIDERPWSSTTGARRTILLDQAGSKINQLDLGSGANGTQFTGFVQRTGLSIVGRKRTGEWIEDFSVRKLVTRVWPKISGGIVSIRVGSHQLPNGAVTWSAPQSFDPSSQKWVDVIVEGPAIAIEFSGATAWKLDGYKLDLTPTGQI